VADSPEARAVLEVLQAARQRADALVAADVETLRSLLHPDLRWTTFRGDVLNRDDYITGNTDGSLRWLGQTLLSPEVVLAGDTAVVTATALDEVERDGREESFSLRLTMTWVRSETKWQCLAGHAGPVVDAA
jgi:ketosteroid isomerase-like protein